jgi:hypothetical protein
MKNNESIQCLNVPGIRPEIIPYYITPEGENIYFTKEAPKGERIYYMRSICIEGTSTSKNLFKNKYTKCLHDICIFWYEGYYVLDALMRHDIIKQHSDYSLKWTLNKTSLAWLFKKMIKTTMEVDDDDYYVYHIPGGFWNPIATLFGMKRETLTKLAYNEKEYGGKSQDIEKLETILKENRIQLQT